MTDFVVSQSLLRRRFLLLLTEDLAYMLFFGTNLVQVSSLERSEFQKCDAECHWSGQSRALLRDGAVGTWIARVWK